MLIGLVILGLGFIALAVICQLDTDKIKKLKFENARLIALYEPIRQKQAGPTREQIQDVSDNGKALLQTIIELLREQGSTLDLVHGFIKQSGPAPVETPSPAPAEIPAPAPVKKKHTRRVTKEKKTVKASKSGNTPGGKVE